ncbi:MAG: AarF/UbiB family protein, partial [Actinomycetia bacterium]|nr:AarF/UbiB family protein [Actinomycetes bacterium]
MGLTGRARYARTLGMALRIVAELWWLRRTRWLRGHRQDAAASALYDRQARRFTVFATRMGGLIVKLGQFLSVRVDLLPGEYIAVLSKLQDALPAVPTRDIVTTIEDELHRPLASIFATFDETPIAAASLGQVHRATLPDGTPVAVKVLRPGIEDLVATDLASLRALLRLLDRAFGLGRILDVADLEADFTATFTDELDYLSEGRHAEEFQRDLLFNPHVDIPQIHWERTTRRVLTGEFMDGVRVDDLTRLDAAGVDRSALAANLAGVFFEMVLEHGRYHADPHPGNVFVRPDGVIQLIDFGMVGTVDPAARPRFAALVTGLVRRDAAGVVRALKDLGFLGPGADTAHLATLLGPRIDAIVGDVAHFYTSASVLDSMMSGQVHLSVG